MTAYRLTPKQNLLYSLIYLAAGIIVYGLIPWGMAGLLWHWSGGGIFIK